MWTKNRADWLSHSNGWSRPGLYLGQIATRTILNNTFVSAPGLSAMQRSYHYARDNITSLQAGWGAWSIDATGNEVASGAFTVTASVEYPAGTFTQIKFSGSTSGSCAGGASLISDAVSVAIPRDAQFFIRAFITYAGNAPYADPGGGPQNDPANGDALNLGASGGDQTLGGTVLDTGNVGAAAKPLLIIGMTARPSVLIPGDSKASGFHDSFSGTSGDVGEIARTIGPLFPYANWATPGASATSFVANGSRRAALAQYFSHCITDLGGAEVVLNSQTWASTLPIIQNVLAMLPAAMKKFVVTWAPATTSTDSWATTGNQTPVSVNTERINANTAIRAGLANVAGYFDIADAVESARNSGVWKAPGYTNDGYHEVNAGALAIVSAAAINTALISR